MHIRPNIHTRVREWIYPLHAKQGTNDQLEIHPRTRRTTHLEHGKIRTWRNRHISSTKEKVVSVPLIHQLLQLLRLEGLLLSLHQTLPYLSSTSLSLPYVFLCRGHFHNTQALKLSVWTTCSRYVTTLLHNPIFISAYRSEFLLCLPPSYLHLHRAYTSDIWNL